MEPSARPRSASPFSSGLRAIPAFLLKTWPGRLLTLGLLAKLVTVAAGTDGVWLAAIDRVGAAALLVVGAYLVYQVFQLARRRFLWRVRRKLILSYVFIGVVPLLLVVTFFVLCGLLLVFNVSSYLVRARLDAMAEQARFAARTTALELQRAGTESSQTILIRRYAATRAQFPNASVALVPIDDARSCARGAGGTPSLAAPAPAARLVVGAWTHVEPPRQIPAWVDCDGFGGLFVYHPPGSAGATDGQLLVRAIGLPEDPDPRFAVVLDLPVDDQFAGRLQADTGIRIGGASVVESRSVEALVGREDGPLLAAPAGGVPSAVSAGSSAWPDLPSSVAILDFTGWESGEVGQLTLTTGVNLEQMFGIFADVDGGSQFGRILLLVVGGVAVLFLVIQTGALLMGLALARSITGSVHALFDGTERIRRGDLSHRISVTARDQLGELADSFNAMTRSVQELLREMEHKKRLEHELRVAREIQMSLLPQADLTVPGLSVAATCVPAREVGGDYYDCLQLDEHRTAFLIADVAGKGASAALYMAELKGLVMALSTTHASPRELMIRADRIMAATLDTRSFITMAYAVIDRKRGTMTYARAGHTPAIHLAAAPVDPTARRTAQVLTPPGMVLGLQLDRGERFAQLLEEVTVPIQPGDLLVLFTDGISEAMNPSSDCFGEGRLGRIVEEHGHLPSEDLRAQILREVEAFVGEADQHDDMTMILIRIDELAGTVTEAAATLAHAEETPDVASRPAGIDG